MRYIATTYVAFEQKTTPPPPLGTLPALLHRRDRYWFGMSGTQPMLVGEPTKGTLLVEGPT